MYGKCRTAIPNNALMAIRYIELGGEKRLTDTDSGENLYFFCDLG